MISKPEHMDTDKARFGILALDDVNALKSVSLQLLKVIDSLSEVADAAIDMANLAMVE